MVTKIGYIIELQRGKILRIANENSSEWQKAFNELTTEKIYEKCGKAEYSSI